jgi:hypothetical protein
MVGKQRARGKQYRQNAPGRTATVAATINISVSNSLEYCEFSLSKNGTKPFGSLWAEATTDEFV